MRPYYRWICTDAVPRNWQGKFLGNLNGALWRKEIETHSLYGDFVDTILAESWKKWWRKLEKPFICFLSPTSSSGIYSAKWFTNREASARLQRRPLFLLSTAIYLNFPGINFDRRRSDQSTWHMSIATAEIISVHNSRYHYLANAVAILLQRGIHFQTFYALQLVQLHSLRKRGEYRKQFWVRQCWTT